MELQSYVENESFLNSTIKEREGELEQLSSKYEAEVCEEVLKLTPETVIHNHIL